MAEVVAIEVAYVRPNAPHVVALRVPAGTTLREAVERSGLLARCPEIDLARQAVGVFGEVRPPGTTVRDGDRVEIYRALLADPKDRRRRRARG